MVTKKRPKALVCAAIIILFLTLITGPAQSKAIQKKGEIQKAGLETCLKQALENNHRRPASKAMVKE